MKFEWDENKNQSNYDKHGIYFEEAVEVFKSDCITWVDDRNDYGETRVISARKANSRERSNYYEHR